jgi:hypothetical protein
MVTHKYSTNSYLWKTSIGDSTDIWKYLIEKIENKTRQSIEMQVQKSG